MVLIIVSLFLFFLLSNLFIKPKVTVESTKIGDVIRSDTRTITLIERAYYPEDETLVFSFLSPVTSQNVLENMHVSVKKSRSDDTKYRVQLKQINEELYVVTVKDLPDKWDKVDIGIYSNKYDLNTLGDNRQLHFVRKEVRTTEPYNVARSNASFERVSLKTQLDFCQKEIISKQKKVQQKEKKIQKIEHVNNELKKTLDDKTEKEQEEIQTTIHQNGSMIESIQKEIEDLKSDAQELQEQSEKLIEKQNTLQDS